MIDLVEMVWPRLKGAKSGDELKAARRADFEVLRSADWGHDIEVVLEEARRLQDAEVDRRKILEGKAVAYLALIGVLIPLITTFGTNAWDAKLSAAQRFAGLCPLLLAIVYLLAAGSWAFRALDVSASGRVDGAALAKLWSRPRGAPAALASEILVCVRFDQDGANAKASAILMTHAFLRRAAVAFTLLLTLPIIWKPIAEVAQVVSHRGDAKPPVRRLQIQAPGRPVSPPITKQTPTSPPPKTERQGDTKTDTTKAPMVTSPPAKPGASRG